MTVRSRFRAGVRRLRLQARHHPWRVLLVLFGSLVAAKWALSAFLWIPVTWGDSFLYLSRARNLVELGLPVVDNLCGPAYPPLYSFLLIPAYVLGSSPESSFHLALLIGALAGSTLLFPCFLLHRLLTGKAESSLAVAALVGGSSVSVAYGLSVMAENLFLPLFAWFCLMIVRHPRPEPRRAAAVGLLLSCLILTKSLAWALLPGAAWLVLGPLLEKGRRPQALVSGAAMAAGVAVPLLGWAWWDAYLQTARPVPLTGEYPLAAYRERFLSLLGDPAALSLAARMALGQLAYLFVSTFGLAGAAAVGTVPKLKAAGERTAWAALAIMAGGLVAASTLHSLVYHGFEPERYGLFGRYVDGLIPVCMVVGAAVLQNAGRTRLSLAAWLAVLAVASILILPADPPIWLHRTGLFHTVHLKQWLPWPVVLALTAGVLAALVPRFRFRRVRLLALVCCGLIAGLGSAEAFAAIRGASRGLYHQHTILDYLRRHFTDRDRLVLYRTEFENWACFRPHHWMLMYQTGTVPALAGRASELPALEPGGEFYFFSRDYAVRGKRPVASFRHFRLYRCVPQELVLEAVLSPEAAPGSP